jgi:formyltetrahydrofolate synthetase
MNNKEEVSPMTSINQFLNNDVEATIAAHNAGTSHVDNMAAMVNAVNLDADLIKEYLKGFESACIAAGMPKTSVKVLKSNRKCIMEFSVGLRKGQDDKAFWTAEACKKMAVEFAKEASDLSDYAKKCREAINDEKDDEKEFNFKAKLEKLVEKAVEEGYTPDEIEFAMKLVMNPEAAMDAAA